MSTAWIWQRAYWTEKKRVRTLRRAGLLPPKPRVKRRLVAEAAVRRARQAPRMVPSQVTSHWSDGRTRVTDFDIRTGLKTRTHETRSRAKGRDGLRPGQRRAISR
jgi:hypothetical protein